MSEKELPERSLTNLLRLVLPPLAASVGILASLLLNSPGNFGTVNLWLLVPSAVAISFLSFEAMVRVKPNFLLVVVLQLMALSVALPGLSGQHGGSSCEIANLISSIISIALGAIARKAKMSEEKQTSRNFELAIKNTELAQTRIALLKQDEADRRILASDLHDQVLNEIKQIKSKVIALPTSDEVKKDIISDIEVSLDTAGKHIRDVMESLFPSVLENLGLCTALDQLTRDSCQKAGIQGRFLKTIDDSQLEKLSKTEELLLFRLAQEALNNVVKHSQAKTVRVTIEGTDNGLSLSILDDGVGFSEKERGESRGLRYMRLRADLIGAVISWQANANGEQDQVKKGTIVRIDLALDR